LVANAHDASELAERVREVICEEWQGARGSLQSAVVYRRLLEEGVEVPSYQMSAILNAFKVGGLIMAPPGSQREEEVRKHGDLLIRGVSSDLCNSSSS
jgi:predicted methyltransferase MtxX (methanogen marker protein 4)